MFTVNFFHESYTIKFHNTVPPHTVQDLVREKIPSQTLILLEKPAAPSHQRKKRARAAQSTSGRSPPKSYTERERGANNYYNDTYKELGLYVSRGE